MKTNLILLSAFVISSNVFSQTRKIVDAETNLPIPFVNIFSPTTSRGTITNELGEFEWNGAATDSVIISHSSYEPQKLIANLWPELVKLRPRTTLLTEVVVSNYGRNLMKKTFETALKNFNTKNYGKAFYRQITRNDDEATEIHEMFYTLESNNGGVLRNSINEARYAFKNKTDSSSVSARMTNTSSLMLGSSGVSKIPAEKKQVMIPFMPDADLYYTFSLLEKYSVDGEKFAKIAFEPNEDIAKPAAYGEVVINEATLEIRQLSMSIKNSLGMDTLRSAKKKLATSNHLHQITFDFLKNGQLNYIKYNGYFEFFDNEKKHKSEVEAVLYVYEQLSKSKNRLHETELKSDDRVLIRKKKYNAKFWKDNPIVKRTPLQEEITNQFEKDKAFGTMFSKK